MPNDTIKLDADFDSGSLDTARCSIDGDTIHLVGRDNHVPGKWKWLHFTVSNAQDKAPTFKINNQFDTDPARLDNLQMLYQEKGQAWRYFDVNHHDPDAGLFTFRNHKPFGSNHVTVAYGFPYPFSRIVEHTDIMRQSPCVSPTPSADDKLILGMSPGGVDDIGRNIAPNPMFGYQITNPGAEGKKKTIVLMSGVHPNETLANHVLEALLDWLIGDSPQAAELRQRSRIFVYPMANPDGRVAGYNRSTVQFIDRDANRFWREDLWLDMPDIAAVGKALLNDTQGHADIFIDLHCWTDTKYHVGILCKEEGYWDDPVWRAMLALEPAIESWDSGWENPSTETLAFESLSPRFCMTFELMYLPGQQLQDLQRIGRHLGQALLNGLE